MTDDPVVPDEAVEAATQAITEKFGPGLSVAFRASDGNMSVGPATPDEVAAVAVRAAAPLLTAAAEKERDRLSMFEDRYWAVQKVLDHYLGDDPEDGSGEGIAAEVALLGGERDEARAALGVAVRERDDIRGSYEAEVRTLNQDIQALGEAITEHENNRARLTSELRAAEVGWNNTRALLDKACKERDEAKADAERLRLMIALYGEGVDAEGNYFGTPGWRLRELLSAADERDALRASLKDAERERDEARADHEHACVLVAQMHAAAVGEVRGPIRGVVEDVADLRANLSNAEKERDTALSMMLEHEEDAEEPQPVKYTAEEMAEITAEVVAHPRRHVIEAIAAMTYELDNDSTEGGGGGMAHHLERAYSLVDAMPALNYDEASLCDEPGCGAHPLHPIELAAQVTDLRAGLSNAEKERDEARAELAALKFNPAYWPTGPGTEDQQQGLIDSLIKHGEERERLTSNVADLRARLATAERDALLRAAQDVTGAAFWEPSLSDIADWLRDRADEAVTE